MRSEEQRARALSRAAAVGAAAVVGVLLSTYDASVVRADRRWRSRVLAHRSRAVRALMHVIGWSGQPAVHVPVTALVATNLLRGPRRRGAAPAAVAVGAASLAPILGHHAIKLFVKRRRPPGGMRAKKGEPAFPSGHTTQSTAVCATLAWVLVRERRARPAVAAPVAVAIPLLTAASRVYEDMHWTTDVLGGLALGGTLAALILRSYERARARG